MGNSPGVTLDFSTYQPHEGVSNNAGSAVTLDMSTYQPHGAASQSANSDALSGASQATGLSAAPQSTGWRDSIANWSDNVMNDIKYGTDTTGVGTVLKKMGAHGVYSGEPQAVDDYMASLPLGVLRATKGAAEVTQDGKTWQGTKDLVGGGLQAAQIPAAFMGGPATEGAATLADTASGKLFGDVERAGNLFKQVSSAAKNDIPVTDEMYDAIAEAKKLSDAGAKGLPRVITKFFNRVNNVDEPLSWDEARLFYSNVSRLSANEYQKHGASDGARSWKVCRRIRRYPASGSRDSRSWR